MTWLNYIFFVLNKSDIFVAPSDFILPKSVDWKESGAVTKVKIRKNAIAATGAI